MNVPKSQSLPVVRVADIATEENAQRWLIDQLWGAAAVGVIGGAPKCSKTWLALDMSVSVATGTACLDRYEVPEPGPVLIYLAEDSLTMVRERVEGIARHRGLVLDSIPIHVITAPMLRLDREPHRTGLLETARRIRPRLLLLDPLVRLHGIDENHASEVAQFLAYFRSLQRELDLAVVLVHHTKKNAHGGAAAGLGLRGSGDIHAFGDSNLYLRRTGGSSSGRFMLSSEHRAAAAAGSVYLELVTGDQRTTGRTGAVHLAVVGNVDGEKPRDLQAEILQRLEENGVLTRGKLRELLAVQNQRLGEALESLQQDGRISRTSTGWKCTP